MIILSFVLVVIFLYGGAINLPILARDGTHIIIAFIFVGHDVGEWAATDWKDKKAWRSTVNLIAMLALLSAGRLESIFHVALAGWLFAECLIHVAKKLSTGGMTEMLYFSWTKHPPGFVSACLGLLPSAVMFGALNWPDMADLGPFTIAALLGFIPLIVSFGIGQIITKRGRKADNLETRN